jgi:hypothetical protein
MLQERIQLVYKLFAAYMLQFFGKAVYFVPVEAELLGKKNFPKPMPAYNLQCGFFTLSRLNEIRNKACSAAVFWRPAFHHVRNGSGRVFSFFR